MPAAIFGLYTHLVTAAFAEDIATATVCAQSLLAHASIPATTLAIRTMDDADLGSGNATRYHRLLTEDEPDQNFPANPVTPAVKAATKSRLAETLALLATAPELAAELAALVREIILVESTAPPGDLEALVFDGASTFYLWGAIFLNAARLPDRLAMAIALVHEASHLLLFGMSLGAPLAKNPPTERHASPLRHDPRPMDGLIHATYVLARMIDAIERLLAAGALTQAETADARSRLARHRNDYATAAQSVRAHARLTPPARTAIANMRAAMPIAEPIPAHRP